jgi:hypothetical protein
MLKKLIAPLALFEIAQSRLTVLSPQSLVDLFPGESTSENNVPGVIRASYANFGFIPYGHTIVSTSIINQM